MSAFDGHGNYLDLRRPPEMDGQTEAARMQQDCCEGSCTAAPKPDTEPVATQPRRLRVYISGPISDGDREHNFNQAADAHHRLLKAGFAVLNPMLSMKLPGAWDVPHAEWIASDLPWVEVADALFLLPGWRESKGAGMEVKHASLYGVPCFADHAALCCWARGTLDPPETPNTSETVLEEAARLVDGERQAAYGSPGEHWKLVAQFWSLYLQGVCKDQPVKLAPHECVHMMILLKLARDMHQRRRDNPVDIAGYARCLELVGEEG